MRQKSYLTLATGRVWLISYQLRLSHMWDRFFRQRAYKGITRSCMRWYVRKNYLTWVKTTEILIWCARNNMEIIRK